MYCICCGSAAESVFAERFTKHFAELRRVLQFAPGKNDRYVVFSFNTNMLTLSPLSKRVDIYTPRFVQVDLSEFF